MRLAELSEALDTIAPPALAEPWDNVGLLLGDPEAQIRGPVLLALDLTDEVADEAVRRTAAALVVYHPPIFEPLRRLTPAAPRGRAILRSAGAGIAILSPHTALDAAPGGLADWLADQVGDRRADGSTAARRPIVPSCPNDPSQTVKIVVFVPTEPAEALDRVRDSMARAGAGDIGAYSRCSFVLRGWGTFLGGEGSNPAVGKKGQLERVDEFRLEMVCAGSALAGVIAAIKRSHPYEEPAIDVYDLVARPDPAAGAGRLVSLDHASRLEEFGARLKSRLGSPVQAAAAQGDGRSGLVAVVPGSGGALVKPAIEQGAGIFVTGELKHHDMLGALERGCSVVLLGHGESERPYLPILARRLAASCPGVALEVARSDRPLLSAM